jgi:flagellar motor switch/type III secretory pathway protein FliN
VASEELANDLDLPLAVVAGDVTLSARALLELTPGQVLSLGRTLGGPVELRAGARTLARGELVEIDGELGVRITELVDAAPAVVATRG